MKSYLKIYLSLALALILTAETTVGQDKTVNDKIGSYFEEIKANTNYYSDLWNIDLYGPILFVEQESRAVYANYPDSAGLLKQTGEIFTGILPNSVNDANTAIKWSGRTWAMVKLPLPVNKNDRLDLLSHELFHRSQPILGFKMSNPSNNHLDQKDGRVYLILEIEALRQALAAVTNSEMNRNLANALYFRNMRDSIYPDAKSSENLLELNEGLATYTGIFMSGRNQSQIIEYFEKKVAEFNTYPTFVRSFAYLTTPLYGTLLSKLDKFWNKKTGCETNLTDFFIKSFNLQIPGKLDTETLNQYGYAEINRYETDREEKIKIATAEYRVKFTEQPHLEIRLEMMNISFDPRNIIPLEGYGTVYPTLRLTDTWGVLTVSNGALLGTNWDKITVSEPAMMGEGKASGDGWTLDLAKGYSVHKNSFDNNYSLRKK